MDQITYTPIGLIQTPFKDPAGAPIQPAGAKEAAGRVVIEEAYIPGLKDLDGFSHIILLYHFHRSAGFALEVVPFLDDQPRGLFATRAPRRPNPIGLSVVRLKRIEGAVLYVEGVDMVDGTPLLDIKPYVPQFDAPAKVCCGWLEKAALRAGGMRADERFKD
ncbi:MAG: tRNA (N6-threonylcarbamoyladenosine(37)-N6)-methyltransferase TrmO [Deltaproteobacteria bacterium]|nr:tRNA (N6-threonylcarbamoyladenosine(37)-N6)-methyltransferase TrmO [Deltaproteobacteria bacterium]